MIETALSCWTPLWGCGIINEGVLRSLANSALSLMMVATFLWGGCVSCEQFFMFPGKQQGCCNKSGQCERPGKSTPKPQKPEKVDCNRLPLDRGGSPHVVPLPAILPAQIAADFVYFPLTTFVRPAFFEIALDPSPPDWQALNSTFLI